MEMFWLILRKCCLTSLICVAWEGLPYCMVKPSLWLTKFWMGIIT